MSGWLSRLTRSGLIWIIAVCLTLFLAGTAQAAAVEAGTPSAEVIEGDAPAQIVTRKRARVPPVLVPVLGKLDVAQLSLPILTLTLASLDSINPCAFFVLLFLLSLLVHARDRTRMLLIGLLFVMTSGLVYFAFMAAWLNLFMVTGNIGWITFAAGVFAVLMALLNIKDFFWFKKGLSLSIPDSAKPKLFKRMRKLIAAEHMGGLIFGTLFLALTANSYELLCTAGFPMVFTRVLTLENLSNAQYYLYLAAYNVIYIIPLLTIVLIFVFTLGQRKLREEEGRFLKLLSGVMMLELGLLLIFAPGFLNNMLTAVGLLGSALIITWLVLHKRKAVPDS